MTDVARLIMVGCGHMGTAMVRGILGSTPNCGIVIVENSAERREALARYDGLTVTSDLRVAEGDFVVLAIPPQAFRDFADAERHRFSSGTPVLSVMAGLRTESIGTSLGTTQVVRSIPNTPSEVLEGMAVYYADPSVSETTIAQADQLLKTIGRALRVDSEGLIDDATALCGGGPAFVSYIADAFCRFAVDRGFTEAAGREMAMQVFGGTARLIAESGKPPMQLCREVMTPNGTTERGIAALDMGKLKSLIGTALTASAQRSRELSAEIGVYG